MMRGSAGTAGTGCIVGECGGIKDGSLVIRVAQSNKSCIQRVPREVEIYAMEQMFDV